MHDLFILTLFSLVPSEPASPAIFVLGPDIEVDETWSSFRGPNGSGVVESASLPAKIGEGPAPTAVLLYYSGDLLAPFSDLAMHDDGEHGDGDAGDEALPHFHQLIAEEVSRDDAH